VKRILSVLFTLLTICIFIVYSKAEENIKTMKIYVNAKGKTTVFELNSSGAAKDLFAQLPLTIKVENYSNNKKIFYPPKRLNTTNAPLDDARAGNLAYYAPWGDVVMFYGSFGSASGLYELGHAVSGSEYIKGTPGIIQIDQRSEEWRQLKKGSWHSNFFQFHIFCLLPHQ
jgi:hypothetical protein